LNNNFKKQLVYTKDNKHAFKANFFWAFFLTSNFFGEIDIVKETISMALMGSSFVIYKLDKK